MVLSRLGRGKSPMSLNSVNTNSGAMVALQSLNRTNEAMQTVQKRISTGLRVSDAKDDGAAFAVAQRIRGDMAGLTTANEQLSASKGLLDTTMGSLQEVSRLLVGADGQGGIRATLTKLSSDTISASDRATYTADFVNAVNQMNRALGDASFNGRSLLVSQDSMGPTAGAATTINAAAVTGQNAKVVRNEAGSTLDISALDASTLTFDTRVATRGAMLADADTVTAGAQAGFGSPTAFAMTGGASLSADAARAMLGNGDASGATGTALDGLVDLKADVGNFGGNAAASDMKTFNAVFGAVNSALAKFGADSRSVDVAIGTNRAKTDAFESGLGALVDADLAKESARMQALQIRQQLGTQSLSMANQAPQALLSLFR